MNDEQREELKLDAPMMRRILLHDCGRNETDEFAADMLEIGDSKYFSTAEYQMIDDNDETVDYQGS